MPILLVGSLLTLFQANFLVTLPLLPLVQAKDAPTELSITTPKGDKIIAEIADTPKKRAKGLMFRDHLDSNRGMLFIFPDAQHWTIWMKNTKIPLDLIWLNHKRTIIHIEPNVPGCKSTGNDCRQYQPNHPASFVLELSAGTAQRLHLVKGTPLTFSGLSENAGLHP